MKNLSMQSKLTLTLAGIILLQIGIMGYVSVKTISEILEDQLGKRVLDVAHSVAAMPIVAELIEQNDPKGQLQALMEDIRLKTGARFIVVGDHTGRRIAHPNVELIGTMMSAGDNDPALLEGKSYNSRASGSLGPSLRGKVPVFDQNRQVVGVVSVGYLDENIDRIISIKQGAIGLLTLFMISIGVIMAVLLARGFKKAIFGLEPGEIARLFKEKNAILESIREGVIAINRSGNITMVNQVAVKTLGLDTRTPLLHRHIDEVIMDSGMIEVLSSGKSHLDHIYKSGDLEIIVNRIPIWDQHSVIGVVSSFREKDQIDKLSTQLSQMQEYAGMLRQQTHEYSNKLHTIAGLIQLESYDKAVELIGNETSGYHELIQFLISAVPDPLIAGCILGKYNRAKELNINLNVDRDSHFADIPQSIQSEKIVTLLGNILNNAYQAVLGLPEKHRVVNLSMTDLGNDLIMEVEDSGNGIAKEIAADIYKEGFSASKEPGKGIGLFLVQQELKILGGHLTLNESGLGGACFTLYLPKQQSIKTSPENVVKSA